MTSRVLGVVLGVVLGAAVIALVPTPRLTAQGANLPPVIQPRNAADSLLESRTTELARELRCPVCQGLSIQDSPSELSQQMRALVKEQIVSGKSDEDVLAYFVSKYGEWILLAPDVTAGGRCRRRRDAGEILDAPTSGRLRLQWRRGAAGGLRRRATVNAPSYSPLPRCRYYSSAIPPQISRSTRRTARPSPYPRIGGPKTSLLPSSRSRSPPPARRKCVRLRKSSRSSNRTTWP